MGNADENSFRCVSMKSGVWHECKVVKLGLVYSFVWYMNMHSDLFWLMSWWPVVKYWDLISQTGLDLTFCWCVRCFPYLCELKFSGQRHWLHVKVLLTSNFCEQWCNLILRCCFQTAYHLTDVRLKCHHEMQQFSSSFQGTCEAWTHAEAQSNDHFLRILSAISHVVNGRSNCNSIFFTQVCSHNLGVFILNSLCIF